MVKRIVAWCAVIFGAAVTVESVFVAHHPNWVWVFILVLGVAYFVKNGFMAPKSSSSPGGNEGA